MEYFVPSLSIVAITKLKYVGAVEERMSHLIQLEEDHFVAGYHQNLEKERHKVWHDRQIKNKKF